MRWPHANRPERNLLIPLSRTGFFRTSLLFHHASLAIGKYISEIIHAWVSKAIQGQDRTLDSGSYVFLTLRPQRTVFFWAEKLL